MNDDPLPGVVFENVSVRYGRFEAVRGVSLEAAPGRVLALVGGNGAGKSSLLAAAAGLHPVASGRVLVDGHNPSAGRGLEAVSRVTGWCPDRGGLIGSATVREHVALALAQAGLRQLWPDAVLLADRLGLTSVFDEACEGFSHGMARRASVLLACLTGSRVLLLDEPFDGMDADGCETVRDLIAEARDANVTVIVTTHLLDLLDDLADEVAVMVGGRLRHVGPAANLSGPSGRRTYRRMLTGDTP